MKKQTKQLAASLARLATQAAAFQAGVDRSKEKSALFASDSMRSVALSEVRGDLAFSRRGAAKVVRETTQTVWWLRMY